MRNYYLFILILFLSKSSFTQNLLPNGSFEKTNNLIYSDPGSAFDYLQDWYQANYALIDTTVTGTPDLFDINNLFTLSNTPNFWNVLRGAAEGDFHAGIANHVNYTGYFRPESIATPLTQTLEAGEFYVLEIQARDKGAMGFMGKPPIHCIKDKDKYINVLLDSDSVFVTIDDTNKNSFSDANRSFPLRSVRLQGEILGQWERLGTCFQADGDEQFLGITLNTGTFEVNPPCIIEDEHWDVFHVYYHDIDAIRLVKLQDTYSATQEICADRRTKIDISELVELPKMQQAIEYLWSDGTQSSINYISTAGTYEIEATLDCKTVSIILEVTDTKCDPDIFVPTAFTPNFDGHNDFLEAFVVVDLPLIEYKLTIFDRWGSLLFTTKDIHNRWDGTYKGQSMDNGVYTWILEYTLEDIELGITNYVNSGTVTIMR